MHPDAFAMLKGLDTDILRIVQDIIKIKSKQKQGSTIIIDDIKKLINPESKIITEDSRSSNTVTNIDNSVLEKHHNHKVLLDASINVNTGEGVGGYTALFLAGMKNLFVFYLYVLRVNESQKLHL